MDNVLKALNDYIGTLNWKLEYAEKKAAQMEGERDALRAQLAAIPPTLSRAQYDALVDEHDAQP